MCPVFLSLAAEIIKRGVVEGCKSQENGLALLWTLGIFALNIGPVPMGFVLDFIGPCFTSILGEAIPHLHLTRARDCMQAHLNPIIEICQVS